MHGDENQCIVVALVPVNILFDDDAECVTTLCLPP